MSEQVKERIRIIDSYKSYYNWEDKTPDQQLRWIKWTAIPEFIFAVFFLGFIIVISAISVFSEGPGDVRWGKAGLLVFIVLSYAFRAPVTLIEFLLKNHKKKIQGLDKDFSRDINSDLQAIIGRLNSRRERLIIVGVPTIIILIAAIFQYFEFNPYWNAFAWAVLFYGVFMLARIFINIRVVINNISWFDRA